MEIKIFSIDMYSEVRKIWEEVDLTLGSSDTKEEVERVRKHNPDLFLVGKKYGKIIAVVIGAFDGRRGYVHHLAVHPRYQKKGYGKLMMDELVKRFIEKKVHKVHLFIEKRNSGVIRFYKKLGWEVRDDLEMMSLVPDEELYKRNKKGNMEN